MEEEESETVIERETEQELGEEFSARPYQVELLERAKERNTIVCLGTGTGKTFISVMLIKELAHEVRGTYKNGGKRTFFLVNTGKRLLLDCEQSLSFPRVARVAICEGRARAARSAGAEEEEKERDCGGILIFSICRL